MGKPSVAVIGLGYAGLPFAVSLALRGYHVIGVDIDESRIEALRRGESYIQEPGIPEAIKRLVREGLIEPTMDFNTAVDRAKIVFIFVGTPSQPDGSPDLSQLESATRLIAKALHGKPPGDWKLVVVRSTVPPGTTRNLVKPILEESGLTVGNDIGLAFNPEFAREGCALQDHLNPNRIVIGEYDKRSGDALESFYREFLKGKNVPIIRTSLENAELIKYAANAFLATKLSFINLIARLARRTPYGDIRVIAEAIGLDPRIGKSYLRAGIGFGGSCLPKDLKALIWYAHSLGVDTSLLNAVWKINETQIREILDILEKAGIKASESRLCILGLAFKGGTDDVRESPSLKLIRLLGEKGASIRAHDPSLLARKHALAQLKSMGTAVEVVDSVEECVRDVDAVIIATEWEEYRSLDWSRICSLMKNKIVVDGRLLLDEKLVEKYCRYYAVGVYKGRD